MEHKKIPYDRHRVRIVSCFRRFQIFYFKLFLHLTVYLSNMVLTRSQMESLTSEELIEELLQISDISCQLKSLNDRFDIFAAKHEELIYTNE